MKNSNLLRLIIALFILSISVELIFLSLYKITKISKFENKYETESRYYKELGVIYNKDKNFKKKAAIFGGSSAAGYASTINFSHILNNMSLLAKENILFHNFSMPATPFYGLQFEILKKFFNDFDIFIIYAGHNEWMHYTHDEKYFPNNANTTDYKSLLKYWDNTITNVTLPDENFFITGNSILFNKLTNNLRTINFLFKSISKTKNLMKKLYYKNVLIKKEGNKDFKKIKYFYDEKFFKGDYSELWSKNFIESVEYIKDILPQDKKLLVITPIANYYYPPTADFIENKSEKIEKIASNAYSSLFKQKLNIEDINELPDGAHKYYLKGIMCIKNKEEINKCIKSLALSREYDQIPFIVRSNIIKYIKKNTNNTNFKNVKYIDLSSVYNILKDDLNNFNYLFLDIMHPSEYGHIFIANEIAKELFKSKIYSKADFDFLNYIKCPNIEYILNGEILKTIETSTKQCNITARKLKSWHVDYVKFIPKNLRYASDEIIELMNKQLQINNQNLNQEK